MEDRRLKVAKLMEDQTAKITEYFFCSVVPAIDLSKTAVYTIGDGIMEAFDGAEDNISVLKCCFDFDEFKTLLARPDFSLWYDAMSSVQGPSRRARRQAGLGSMASISPP